MLLIKVEYVVKDGMRKEFYDSLISNGIASNSRKEEGNVKYEYSLSEDDENILILDEIWTDAETQKAHTQTEYFKRLGDLKSQYVLDTKINFLTE